MSHENFLFPAQHGLSKGRYFNVLSFPTGHGGPVHLGATRVMCRDRRRDDVDLSLSKMDDAGMWVWAGILTVVGLALSYGIAIAWQRWKDRTQDRA